MSGQEWIQVQINTFTAWVNRKIERSELEAPVVNDLFVDLASGLGLLSVLHELIPDLQTPRYNKNPRMDVHKLDNLAVVFNVIEAAQVHLEFVKPRNILEGNQKMILGLIWTLIKELDLKNALKQTGLGDGKDAFLAWVNSKCIPLGFQVNNWTTDFQNGWAFNALIQDLRPDLNAWSQTSPQDFVGNHTRAFNIADSEMDIPPLLRVEDIMKCPDEKSIMTYCLEFLEYEQRNKKLIDAIRASANKGPDPALLAQQQAQQDALDAQAAALELQAANARRLQEQELLLREQQSAQAAAQRDAQAAKLEAQRLALEQQHAALELQRQQSAAMLQQQQLQQKQLAEKRAQHQNLIAQQQEQQRKLREMQLAQQQAMAKQKADLDAKRAAMAAQQQANANAQQAQRNAIAQQQAQMAAQAQAQADAQRQREALTQQYQQQQQMLLMQQQRQMAMMPQPGQMMMQPPNMMGGMMGGGQQKPGNITVVIKDNNQQAAAVPDTIIKGGPAHKQPAKSIDCKKCGATTMYHGPDRNGRVRCRGCSKVLISKGKRK